MLEFHTLHSISTDALYHFAALSFDPRIFKASKKPATRTWTGPKVKLSWFSAIKNPILAIKIETTA